jgi:hypothetical protein
MRHLGLRPDGVAPSGQFDFKQSYRENFDYGRMIERQNNYSNRFNLAMLSPI